MRSIYFAFPFVLSSFIISQSYAQNATPSSSSYPINSPGGLVGLDSAGFIRSPMKGSVDNATVGGTALVNLIPALTSQQRSSSGLSLSQLSTPGILNITADLKSVAEQADQTYTITSYGSSDGTPANSKNAVNITMTKNLWNSRLQTTVPYGESDAISTTLYNGGFGVANSDGSYAGSDGSDYLGNLIFSGYGNNAVLKGSAQYICSDTNTDNPLQPVECTTTGQAPYAINTQTDMIAINGAAVSGHKAIASNNQITAGTWEGMIYTASGTGLLDKLFSYTDTSGIEQTSLTGSGVLSATDLEIRSLTASVNQAGVLSYSPSGCVSLGQDSNGRIALGCTNSTSGTPYFDFNGQGYGSGVRLIEPNSGHFQIETRSSANDSLHDTLDCDALPSCTVKAPLSVTAPTTMTAVTISQGVSITKGLITDTSMSNQASLTPYTYATLGSPITLAVQKYCADCYSQLRSNTYTHTGLVVTWNGYDWTDVIGNPVSH